MLTGDDLTIQLFIGASAVAVLGVAVTQAGWTHKWFVSSLFLIAAALAFLAVYWKQIRDAHPEIGPVASEVAGNSISWFTLLLVGFGVVFVLDLLARTGWLAGTPQIQGEKTSERPNKEKIKSGPRMFINADPNDLMRLCEGRTSIQADQITTSYIGSWLKVSGDLRNMGHKMGVVLGSIQASGSKSIMILFDAEWKDRATQLIAGKALTVVGEIVEIRESEIMLQHCEIVD